jgi:hypothetical protein
MKNTPFFLIAAIAALTITRLNAEGWSVYYLNPPGSQGSTISDTAAWQQAGSAKFGTDHAVIWQYGLDARLYYDLHPANAASSYVNATTGGQQVGSVRFAGLPDHACLWKGTPESFTDLHPAGSKGLSYVSSTSGIEQAGFATFDTIIRRPRRNIAGPPVFDIVNLGPNSHAGIWSLSADSFIDLQPETVGLEFVKSSGINSTTGEQQGGYVTLESGEVHAGIWAGSSNSFIDLHPPGASSSTVNSTTGSQQAGNVFTGVNLHAAVWSGSAASFVDFNPTNATDSNILQTIGLEKVGRFAVSSG